MPSSSSQSTAVHDPCGSAASAARVARSACARISVDGRGRPSSRPNLASDLEQAALAGAQRGDLGVHVTDHQLGHPAVEADQLDDLAVRARRRSNDLGAREEHPLLVHVGRVQHVARVLGAEVHPVGPHAHEPHQHAVGVGIVGIGWKTGANIVAS